VHTADVSAVPARIHADRAAGQLQIEWRDGHRTVFEAQPLRWLCPCAFCRGEAGLPGWLDSGPTLTPDQVRLEDVALVGNYAIAPTWADGHHTGLYSFTLLRARCPCETCERLRSDGRAAPGGNVPPAADRGTHGDHGDHGDHA
jgi:DUF971 family protein